MWKLVLAVIAALSAVGLGSLVGGVKDAEMDEGAQNALNFAVGEHNRLSNDAFVSQMAEVVKVQKQLVAGIKYIITVKMERTPCRKSEGNGLCTTRSDPAMAQPYQCTFTVWHRPWISDIRMTDRAETASLRRLLFPDMKVLNKDELRTAEGVLLKHLPKSFKVYGYVYGMNRNKQTTLEVIVDTWPDFKVIICLPDPTNNPPELSKKVTYFSTDEQTLRKVLTEEEALDWSSCFLLGGLDISHIPMLKQVSSDRGVNSRCYTLVHLLYLPDSSHLLTPTVDSELESRISPLDLSHADLVNKTWKFGGNQQSYNNIKNLISNYPSCCITDGRGQPVSWVLVYDYCAMGMLYTLPEHRGKGYAKVLVSAMARRLHAEGFPVYCFIEEENVVSYKLFKNLGFTEDPSYRAAWFQFNF